jgi:DNA-binding HxlR family transcriptional regulator
MALLDLLGRRWALRILWELSQEPAGFRSLQARCDGMSPSVLAQRLAELCAAGVVTPTPAGAYALSDEGDELMRALRPLNEWAARWAQRSMEPVERDAAHP